MELSRLCKPAEIIWRLKHQYTMALFRQIRATDKPVMARTDDDCVVMMQMKPWWFQWISAGDSLVKGIQAGLPRLYA